MMFFSVERPPVLFEVPCLENAFQVGGYPWHYIITPNKKTEKGIYHIRSLDNHTLVSTLLLLNCCYQRLIDLVMLAFVVGSF